MKKIAVVLFLLTTTVFSQNKNKLITQLDQNIKEIENVIKLSQLKIELSTIVNKPFNANDANNFENYKLTEQVNQQEIQAYLEKLSSNINIAYPYSFISIKNDEYKLLDILGKDAFYFMHNPAMQPTFMPQTIVYKDGTTTNAKNYITPELLEKKYSYTDKSSEQTAVDTTKMSKLEKAVWLEKSSFYQIIGLNSHKPIQSISYNVKVPIPRTTLLYLEKVNDSINTKAGYIKLVALTNNKAVIEYPTPLNDSLEINAIYKNGKVLKEKNSNTNTLLSKKERNEYYELIAVMKEAKNQILAGKIVTEKELEHYFENKIASPSADATTQKEIKYTQKSITFSGPIAKLVIRMADENPDIQNFSVTYTATQDKDQDQDNYQIASDFNSRQYGILANNGEWLISPQFDSHFRMCNPYYFTDQIDDRDNLYHLNPTTKKLQKVDYHLDSYEIFADKYVKIEPQINGLNGIANAQTAEIVVPMVYDYIRLQDNSFWIGRNAQDKTGVLDTNFKTVLPFEFTAIDYQNDFFYTRKEIGNKEVKDIYDKQGNNLTQGKYYSIENYNDGRVLVETVKITKEGYYNTTGQYFLDQKGNPVIDLRAKGYSDAQSFKNGLAAVKSSKTDNYGFIDTTGKLVLPCNYYSVSFGFFKRSGLAPVQLSDKKYALIDKKGKVIKIFPSSFSVVNYAGANENLFLLVNNVWYDDYGNKVPKK